MLADACQQRDEATTQLNEVIAERVATSNKLDKTIAQRDEAASKLDEAIAERDRYKAPTEELIRLAKIQRFGASSEKHARQFNLFDEAELDVVIDDLRQQVPDESTSEQVSSTPANKKPRNRGFSATLNRIRHEILLSDEEKAVASKTFFSKVKEELEYVPAQLNVIEIWQEKAVFETEHDEQMVAAARPIHPLGKCIATTSLLAHIITSKNETSNVNMISRLNPAALVPAVYASRITLPLPMQDSLPASG